MHDSRGNAMTFSYTREESANVTFTQTNEVSRLEDGRRSPLYLQKICFDSARRTAI